MTSLTQAYRHYHAGKYRVLLALTMVLLLICTAAVFMGGYALSFPSMFRALVQTDAGPAGVIIWNIRLPRVTNAVIAGAGLALSGLTMQSLLKNPLASPFTLGVSQGAAFGAALAIVFLSAGIIRKVVSGPAAAMIHFYAVTAAAFLGAMGATVVIILLTRVRRLSPESVILAGVAMSSLFTSATILIQYLSTETEIASVVFWTFGDVARSNWKEIAVIAAATTAMTIYLLTRRWQLNALSAGDDVARSLGVNVDRIRLLGLFVAALISALITACNGIIGFIGLLAPHMARRLAGSDYRNLIPCTAIIGALLLTAADTIGRLWVGSGSLPVGVLTSFMGAPLFLYLLIKGYRR